MAKPNFKAVEDYMAAQPSAAPRVLERVRSTIKKALPRAQEVISYQIPAYKMNGRVIVYFAGWSEHFSLYPAIGRLQAAFKEVLQRYEVSKGTIRFPLSGRPPLKLIERIIKFRAKEIAGKDTAYRSTKRQRS
jgi:uncharacterized protein YdhG (YjbR/CyaY superfamily)